MSQTSHFSSHKPGEHYILLLIPGSSCHVDDIIHKNERGGSRGDGERRGIISQYISHYYFNNDVESVYGEGRSRYRSQARPYTSHHSDLISTSLVL